RSGRAARPQSGCVPRGCVPRGCVDGCGRTLLAADAGLGRGRCPVVERARADPCLGSGPAVPRPRAWERQQRPPTLTGKWSCLCLTLMSADALSQAESEDQDEFITGFGNPQSGLCHALQTERCHVNSGATEVL
ncbi:hypothetical protein Nmel_001340, partial [Mimus melanotis]